MDFIVIGESWIRAGAGPMTLIGFAITLAALGTSAWIGKLCGF